MKNHNHAGKYATLIITNLDGTTVSYPVLVTRSEHSERWGCLNSIEFAAKTVGGPTVEEPTPTYTELKKQTEILQKIANHIGVGSSSSSTLRPF